MLDLVGFSLKETYLEMSNELLGEISFSDLIKKLNVVELKYIVALRLVGDIKRLISLDIYRRYLVA